MCSKRWIALLGRQDEPTDALKDYCDLLAAALHKKQYSLEISRVRWVEHGWCRALNDVSRDFADCRGCWVLVQYTALAWSRRGFPLGFAFTVSRLKRAGARVLIVFHDPDAFGGHRLRDRVRRQVQLELMQRAAGLADKIATTVSPKCVCWMHPLAIRAKTFFAPVGSNLPIPTRKTHTSGQRIPVIIVFGFSHIDAEAVLLASVVSRAAIDVGPLHLTVFGRGARDVGTILRPLLDGCHVELEVFGIVESERAGALFANADVQLFVRSGLSSRRGSGIAGIACGLPIVGFSDGETAFPITEAGVRLVPAGDVENLVRELVLVLKQETLREDLRRRSENAAEQYFSWDRIADAYISALR